MFEKGKESPQDQRQVRKKNTIHTRKSHSGLNIEWAKVLFFFVANRRFVIWLDFQGC